MEKKNVILLTVIAVATLLITVVGATFAYFAANVTGKDGNDINITSADGLTLTYDGGETIEGTNILPGWGETYNTSGNSYTLTVTNNNSVDVTYTIKWNSVINGLNANDKKNLTYTATGKIDWVTPLQHSTEKPSDLVSPTSSATFPDAGNTDAFVSEQKLQPGEKATYTITVKYKYDEENEQDSKGASFSAKLNIADSDIKVSNHVSTPID